MKKVMILNHLKISDEEIIDVLKSMGYTKVSSTILEQYARYLVDFGKDFMKHQFDVDIVNPKSNKITISEVRAQVLKQIWKNLTYKIRDNNIEILLSSKVLNNSGLLKKIMASEYGNSGTKPYPLFRKFVYFVENNQQLLLRQFVTERGI